MAPDLSMPEIALVLARTAGEGIIGRDGDMPWRLRTDLRRFKALTRGGALLMGRKTFASIGRPLSERASVVLSRAPAPDGRAFSKIDATTEVAFATTPDDCLLLGDFFSLLRGRSEVFVIGGAQMYGLFAARAEKIYLTEVSANLAAEPGDAIFDMPFPPDEWATLDERDVPAGPTDDFPTRFRVLARRRPRPRRRNEDALFSPAGEERAWMRDLARAAGFPVR